VLYDKLWEIAERANPRLMFTAGASVIAAVLIWNGIGIWKRMRRIEAQVSKMEGKLNLLEMQDAHRLMTKLKANSKVGIDLCDMAVEMADGDTAGLTVSPPTMPVQPESAQSAEFRSQPGQVPRRSG